MPRGKLSNSKPPVPIFGGHSGVGKRQSTRTLEELEAVVKAGLATFIEVGTALAEVRDRKLYRPQFATFEKYLEQRWALSRAHGHRLIAAAELVHKLSPTGDVPPPTTERATRELGRVPPEERDDVWRTIVHLYGATATADTVRRHVDRYLKCEESATEAEADEKEPAPVSENAAEVEAPALSAADDSIVEVDQETCVPSNSEVAATPGATVPASGGHVRKVLVGHPAADDVTNPGTLTTTAAVTAIKQRFAVVNFRSHCEPIITGLDANGNVPDEVMRSLFRHELDETVAAIGRLMDFPSDWVGGWMASSVRTRLEPAIDDLTQWTKHVEDAATAAHDPALGPGEGTA